MSGRNVESHMVRNEKVVVNNSGHADVKKQQQQVEHTEFTHTEVKAPLIHPAPPIISTGAAGLAEEIVGQGFTASAARISGGSAEVHVQPCKSVLRLSSLVGLPTSCFKVPIWVQASPAQRGFDLGSLVGGVELALGAGSTRRGKKDLEQVARQGPLKVQDPSSGTLQTPTSPALDAVELLGLNRQLDASVSRHYVAPEKCHTQA
ncbi:hypothetical protein BV898_04553 [Hypsibius exemplaris]|uniref:Uncharacterized protein n=1 Tax=Hypsibius exemplaris TaxID=2072580 RepID=A0A1W0X2I1_HYPEX|nr:hypothetical protein BV898_04553 [Hypsibius exemplaris]